MSRQYPQLPAAPTGAALFPRHGPWAIIVPQAARNIARNPSLETDSNGYTLSGTGNIERTTARAYAGAYSLRLYNLGAFSGVDIVISSDEIVAGQPYVLSFYMWGQGGKRYTVQPGNVTIRTHGIWWERVVWPIVASSSGILSINIQQQTTGGSNQFFIDAVQVEAGLVPTTYLDGDMRGFSRDVVDYAWAGTPHASPSTRSATTRSGGKVVYLHKLGMFLLLMAGLGLAPQEHLTMPAANGGSIYQRTIPRERLFNLVYRMYGLDFAQADERRALLTTLLNSANTLRDQPFLLQWQPVTQDDQQLPTHYPCKIACFPTANTNAGSVDNAHTEPISLEFRTMLPWVVREGGAGAALDGYQALAPNGLVFRNPLTGKWTVPGAGVAGTVNTIVSRPQGGIYFAGSFTNAGGVAGATNVAVWDGTAIRALGTGINGTVYALAVGADGRLYAGGTFTTAGGVAANNIARYDPTTNTWAALGSGVNGTVEALEFGTDSSRLYVGGAFTQTGATVLNRFAAWDVQASAWIAFTAGGVTGANGAVQTIERETYGSIYIGGSFTQITNVSAQFLAQYNGSTFASVGASPGGSSISALTMWQGDLYAVGDFTTIGGIAARYIARWNGIQWQALDAGLSSAPSLRHAISPGQRFLHVAGQSLPAIGSFVTYSGWNGSDWAPGDIRLLGTINALHEAPDGTLWHGGQDTGLSNLLTSDVVSVDNPGTAPTYPTITFYGPTDTAIPTSIFHIKNVTTGAEIYFNFKINRGEVATLVLDPSNISFTSTFRGNIIDAILPSSNISQFALQPGVNSISTMFETQTQAGTLLYDVRYAALADSVIRPR